MRNFPNILAEIIEDSGKKLNAICKTSGVSHTYVTKLMNHKINRPGKDKIASVLLSLNYSISKINEVLATYDYRPLNKHDIPEIKQNNIKRKIEGTALPHYNRLYLDLLLSAMARIGGTKIIIKDRPSSIFKPEDLYLFDEYPFANDQETSFENDRDAYEFHIDLTLALFKERRELFLNNIHEGFRFETYMCRHCLTEYVETKLNMNHQSKIKKERFQKMLVNYFANALSATILEPEQHQLKVVNRCAYFECQVQDAEGKYPKVSFPGKKRHDYANRHDNMKLEGFTSDAPAILQLFQKEIEDCRSAIDRDIDANYPNQLVTFIISLFQKHGQGDNLKAAIDESLSRREFALY